MPNLKKLLAPLLAAALAIVATVCFMSPPKAEAKGWVQGGPVRPLPGIMLPPIWAGYPLGGGSQASSPGFCNDSFKIQNTPAAAAQASASKTAGGAGVSNVCLRCIATVSAGATAQTPIVLNLRDGATGAGTVIASWSLACPTNSCVVVDTGVAPLFLMGSPNTAMTLEFAGAGVAASQETCTIIGIGVQ